MIVAKIRRNSAKEKALNSVLPDDGGREDIRVYCESSQSQDRKFTGCSYNSLIISTCR